MLNGKQKFDINYLINIWLLINIIINIYKIDYQVKKVEKL